jgi:hypothetical protein
MKPMKLAFPLLCVALALSGCKDRVIHVEPGHVSGATADPALAKPELVLRSYAVPAGAGQQVKSMLNSLLYNVKDHVGASAQLTPSNELVVIAPAGIHDGIAAMIAKMGEGGAAEMPPTIEMNYWIVFGVASTETAIPAELKEIEGALAAVSKAQGPMKFTMRDRASVVSQSDEHASSHGRYAEIKHVASYGNGVLRANMEIMPRLEDNPARLQTMVRLEPGKTLVLGQVGYGEKNLEGGPERQMFYVVRANVTTAP